MYYYGPMMDGYDWGWGLFMMVIWFLILTVIAVVVIKIVREHGNSTRQMADPLDIAKQRYAKGEITKEQFEQFKKDLK